MSACVPQLFFCVSLVSRPDAILVPSQVSLFLCRNLSPELQGEAVRLISNGTALMKAKQVLPGMVVGGLGPRSTLPNAPLSSLPGSLASQVCNRLI